MLPGARLDRLHIPLESLRGRRNHHQSHLCRRSPRHNLLRSPLVAHRILLLLPQSQSWHIGPGIERQVSTLPTMYSATVPTRLTSRTSICLPFQSNPLYICTAFCASSGEAKTTIPLPFGRPSGPMLMSALTMLPALRNRSLSSCQPA